MSGLREVLGMVAIPTSAMGAGTYTSGPIANPGIAASVVAHVHASTVSGTTQTLNVSIQSSNDNVTWTTIPGSAAAQLTGVGNSSTNAYADDDYIQIIAVVGGTGTPVVTFRVSCLVVTA